jgi:hypothetical protein
LNRSAWAAAGNGVLFYDTDGLGGIEGKRPCVFTEWDATAPVRLRKGDTANGGSPGRRHRRPVSASIFPVILERGI